MEPEQLRRLLGIEIPIHSNYQYSIEDDRVFGRAAEDEEQMWKLEAHKRMTTRDEW